MKASNNPCWKEPSRLFFRYHLRVFLCLMAFIFVASVSGCGSGSGSSIETEAQALEPPVIAPPVVKPNILLIMADDLGYNDLAINNGNTQIDTPNMDQLAREGVRFTRHYASAVCSPARAALLTGLFPERLGYLPSGRGISPEIVTLPERLKAAGYTTWHIGKWHIGHLDRSAWPDRQGFDHWFGFLHQWRLGAERTPEGDIALTSSHYNDPWLESDSVPGKNYPGHLENILTDKAIDVLSDLREAQSPWFLNLWFFAPHVPIQPASEFAEQYPDTPAGKYQALVNQLDFNIGRVLAHLDTIGALENTIVVVVSDNGGTNTELDNNAPFLGKKGTITEGGLRTPLIIKWPDESMNGQIYADTVSVEDIYPTLLEGIGLEPTDDLDGASFYQSVRHLVPAAPKALYWGHIIINDRVSYGSVSADGRWRFYQPPSYWKEYVAPELADLQPDPSGKQRVLPIPPERLQQLKQDYLDWYRNVHTVKTKYVANENGSGVLTGMDFLRTPGFSWYTFGIGIADTLQGPIAAQAGIWQLSRLGDTITAQFGDLILSGDIETTNSCHSIVITGNFARRLSDRQGPDVMQLSLYIDGVESQSDQKEGVLRVDDLSVATVIGDPDGATGSGALTAPVILNMKLSDISPLTLGAFSQKLCAD